ncbi:MAG: FliA/WhiG family RNA polymerase sigma factor [Planctomycetota bacterium]|jgi:RNA polymerase sigma factor for flagellar operon FliA
MKTANAKESAEKAAKTWKVFLKRRDDSSRNGLIEHYLPIVKYTAERLGARLPDEVDVDDLISSGLFGLMDAIDAFDPQRGVKFETYCVPRIRGAILDELRSMDWVPRLVRSRGHKLTRATQVLEAQLGRRPTEKELAKQMKLPMREFRKLQRDARATGLVSLSRKWFETDSHKDVREIDVLEDKRSSNPFLDAQHKDIRELVTRGLSRAERLIIILYYFEQMTMKEIGETLDLSESRVSQVHSAILERLRHQLEKRQKELQVS